jgi:hypothetical protein
VIRAVAVALSLALAAPAAAFETLAVLAAADPPSGPDADLAELAHQLRAACRDRVGGVMDVPTMRARLLGQRSNATVTELDRAYGGALAVYQNGEFESAIRTLKAIVEDLESLPESDDAYQQWVRAELRLAHAALTIGRDREADEAMQAVLRTDPRVAPDPDQYSPTYRRRFEAMKARIRALPARRLQVVAEGFGGSVYVNGRLMGSAPLSLWLPSGTYRVGGASGALHVPSFRVDLQREDRSVVLDFGLAEALRVAGGPGLAVPVARRSEAIVRAGAWLGVDRIVAVTRQSEGEAVFLLGSIYDVRNGALLREGSVRTVAGGVPAANLGALATFLLTGQSSRDVKDRTEQAKVPIAAAIVSPLPAAAGAVSTATGADAQSSPPAAPPPSNAASPAGSTSAPLATPTGTAGAAIAAATATAAATGTAAGTGTATGTATGTGTGTGTAAATAPATAAAAATAGGAIAAASPPAPASRARPPATRAPSGKRAAAAPGATAAPGTGTATTPGAPPSPATRTATADLSATPRSFHPTPPAAAASPAPSLAAAPDTARRWMRGGAYASAVLAGVFTGVAIQQGLVARQADADAGGLVGPGGALSPGTDPARYGDLRSDARAARRTAYLSGGAAVVLAATAGLLGWKSRAPVDAPAALALRF